MIMVELFWSFFQIGMFSIGGGMAAMPLIQSQIVDMHHWLTMAEFTDLITIAEMTPGPISINSATLVGIRVAGFPGAIVATLGCIIPSCIIVSLFASIYFRYKRLAVIQGVLSGLRPAVVALIASAGLSIFIMTIWGDGGFVFGSKAINYISLFIFISAMFVLRKWKLSPVIIILASGAVGGALYFAVLFTTDIYKVTWGK